MGNTNDAMEKRVAVECVSTMEASQELPAPKAIHLAYVRYLDRRYDMRVHTTAPDV